MREETILEKLKHIVYKITLPIWLWSIGFKTLEEYLDALENDKDPNMTYEWLKDVDTSDWV